MAVSEPPLPTSRLASIEHAMEFRYLGGNQNYPVKLTKATISTTPAAGGKLLKINISAVTDQVILRGEGEMEFLSNGVHMDTHKFNLCQMVSCPISVGDFVLNIASVLPADLAPGCYTFKMDLLDQNGRQLSNVAFDFTMPHDSTLHYPDE